MLGAYIAYSAIGRFGTTVPGYWLAVLAAGRLTWLPVTETLTREAIDISGLAPDRATTTRELGEFRGGKRLGANYHQKS